MLLKRKDNFQGKNNKRLHNTNPTNNEGTAAWQQEEEDVNKTGNVYKPSIERVVDAKDWVDNGSKL